MGRLLQHCMVRKDCRKLHIGLEWENGKSRSDGQKDQGGYVHSDKLILTACGFLMQVVEVFSTRAFRGARLAKKQADTLPEEEISVFLVLYRNLAIAILSVWTP